VGALSALYYADRLNQLPIGVIGIAAGTVVLPEMARRIAAGDERGASHAQSRAIELTLLLAVPCLAAFLMVPDLIMRALFMRGAFTAADAEAAGATLRAYAIGLLPFVLIRSLVATFFARGDTATPVKASLSAAAANLLLKIGFFLFTSLAQVGLALATSIGAWINAALIVFFAQRAGLLSLDASLRKSIPRLMIAGLILTAALWAAEYAAASFLRNWTHGRDEATLVIVMILGAGVYGAALMLLYRARWRGLLRG
jgi:putative peptidoglycan lipid II flippase